MLKQVKEILEVHDEKIGDGRRLSLARLSLFINVVLYIFCIIYFVFIDSSGEGTNMNSILNSLLMSMTLFAGYALGEDGVDKYNQVKGVDVQAGKKGD